MICEHTYANASNALVCAVHEVGHLCGYLAQSTPCRVRYLEISTNGGNCCVAYRVDQPALERAAICLAGAAAELRFMHGPAWRPSAADLSVVEAERACATDLSMARAAVTSPEELEQAWRFAAGLVCEHWPRILAIAELLAASGRLDGDKAVAVWVAVSHAATCRRR